MLVRVRFHGQPLSVYAATCETTKQAALLAIESVLKEMCVYGEKDGETWYLPVLDVVQLRDGPTCANRRGDDDER